MEKILIIGATSGIGRELARQYAAAGHLVGATGRRQDMLYSLKTLNSSIPTTNFSSQIEIEKQQEQHHFLWNTLDSLVAVQWASQWVRQNEPEGNLLLHEHLMIITALDRKSVV